MRKWNPKINRFVIALLTVSLLLHTPATSGAEGEGGGPPPEPPPVPDGPATVTAKDEVVYARLSGGGEVQDIYVVNHFTLARGGSFSDRGGYASVVNLTDLQPIGLSDDTVSARTAGEHFYYQGTLASRQLPWRYTVAYRLDGAAVQPGDLAGRSGRLEIRMTSAKNDSADQTFYDHYMQQVTVTLNNDDCANITAGGGGATTASAGKNRMLVFTALPKQDVDVTVTADVRDFEMAGIEITAMPYAVSIELPGTGDMLGEFSLLTEALAALDGGVEKLRDGTAEIASGAEKLKEGSATFHDGLSQAGANAAPMTGASAQIRDALSQLSAALNGANAGAAPELAGLDQLTGSLARLTAGLDQVSDGMERLKDGYAQAYAALDKALADIPDYQISPDQFQGLYAKADDGERALLNRLSESYAAAMIVRGTYEQTKTAFQSVNSSLDTLSGSVKLLSAGLAELSKQLAGALSPSPSGDNGPAAQARQLAEGIAELSNNYAAFHGGLAAYMAGVSELADGYSELNDGVAGLSGGAADLSGGVAELGDGTRRLAAETADMPGRFQSQIDSLVGEYTNTAFTPVSFTSAQNEKIDFVQFVFKTEGVEKPKAETAPAADGKQPGFWDRLAGLFT